MKPAKLCLPLTFYFVTLLTGCGGGADFKGDASPKPVEQKTETEIRFGVDKVFRIGDDNYSNTSCKEQVASYKLSGTRYFFEFEVTEPQTQVDVSINKVCGVDYLLTNSTKLIKDSQIFQVQPVLKTTEKIQYQSVTLEPGKYAVIVESGINYTEVQKGDHDDFLVGDIAIKANKKIGGGNVRTE